MEMPEISGMGNGETAAKPVKSAAGSILQWNREIETFPQHMYVVQVCMWMASSHANLETVSDGKPQVLYIQFAPSNI